MTQPFTTTSNAAAALRHANQPEPAEPVTTPNPADPNPEPPTPQKNSAKESEQP